MVPTYFLFVKDYRTMTSGWQGAPYFRIYGRGLVSKPAISLKKSWGDRSRYCTSKRLYIQQQLYATPVKNLLFWPRLEFFHVRQGVSYVLHATFQHKRGRVLIFVLNWRLELLSAVAYYYCCGSYKRRHCKMFPL